MYLFCRMIKTRASSEPEIPQTAKTIVRIPSAMSPPDELEASRTIPVTRFAKDESSAQNAIIQGIPE